MKTALTIAGSDCSGGAGIQADIKTMLCNGVYAMSAITALTAQNTSGIYGIKEVAPDFLKAQLDAVFTDIFPDAVKIGMVSSPELIEVIGDALTTYNAQNIILDPVMISTSGSKLLSDRAINTLIDKLLPIVTLLTPNIPEAEVLSGISIKTPDDMIKATEKISNSFNCAVLCKGGHQIASANDLLYANQSFRWYNSNKINNPNTHGTGCTLSSAIAANLAKGYSLEDSIDKAKNYILGAIEAMLDLGKGSGPMDHGFNITGPFVN